RRARRDERAVPEVAPERLPLEERLEVLRRRRTGEIDRRRAGDLLVRLQGGQDLPDGGAEAPRHEEERAGGHRGPRPAVPPRPRAIKSGSAASATASSTPCVAIAEP